MASSKNPGDTHPQFRRMVLASILLHIALVGVLLLLYCISPQVELAASSPEAQIVQLYDLAELPDLPEPDIAPPSPEPLTHDVIAFQQLSTIAEEPTPTPTPPPPSPTPTPHIIPTPTPIPIPTPTPRPIPTRRPSPTAIPPPSPSPTPASQAVAAYEVPRRRPVLERPPAAQNTPVVFRKQTPTAMEGSSSETAASALRSAGSPSVLLDQTDAFPYPEYLTYLEKKIAGLWIPQGSGSVSLYLIIGRNGKILKTGVDKGEGFGVEKLRDSVIRAVTLITRFDPLPPEYHGMVLRVRIAVRR